MGLAPAKSKLFFSIYLKLTGKASALPLYRLKNRLITANFSEKFRMFISYAYTLI